MEKPEKNKVLSELGKKSSEKLLKRLGSKKAVSEYFANLRLKRKDLQKTPPVHH